MAKGDALASGGIRAAFPPAGGKVTKERWDEIFKDYNPDSKSEKKSEDER